MRANFYVLCFNFYPERPYFEPHFDRHATARFGNLTNALKYALKDRKVRGGFSSESDTAGTNVRYGGCEIRRGKSADTGSAVALIHYDGTIEYYSEKAQHIAEGLAR